MASDIEQRNFVDKDGLEQFWDDIQAYMTRMYKGLPAGMQFSRIFQQDGQLHILVEPFGGDTLARKEASRNSLDVYSKEEVDAAISDNGSYLGQMSLAEVNSLQHEPHNGDSVNIKFDLLTDSEYIDPVTHLGKVYNNWDGVQGHSYVEVADGDNVIYDMKALTHIWDRQAGNYKHKQDTVSSSFGEYETLLDFIQDENGDLTVHKQVIPTATVSKLGLTTLKGTIAEDDTDNTTAATPKAVADAITAAIEGLDVAELEIGQAKTVGTIEEVDGKIVVTAVPILVDTANIADNAVTSAKIADGTIQSADIGIGQVHTTNIADDAVTNDKVADNAIGTDQLINDAVNGDKIVDDSIGNEHIADDAVHTEQILDGSVTTGKIANDAVTAEKVKDGETLPVNISGNAATATTVEEGGELDQRIGALETGKADKVTVATAGNFAGLDAEGNLVDSMHKHSDYKTKQTAVADPTVPQSGTTTSLSFIDTISQDENGVITPTKKTLPKSDAIDLDSSDTLATSAAVKAAVDASHTEVAGLNCTDQLSLNGHFNKKYITRLSQLNGQMSYDSDSMAEGPTENSAAPVTGHALYTEHLQRSQFDEWVRSLIPGVTTPSNQLADKAYVDAIGERLEARYLSSYDAEHDRYIPFPTYAAFEAAASRQSPDQFYYNEVPVSEIGSGKLDNNDVIVITSDETHLNEIDEPSTTRYRYQCDVSTGDNGHWFFEYVINNTALNAAQLLAINSGITAEYKASYDNHLASQGQDPNHANPHHVTFDQLGGRNGVDSTEIGVLDGVDTDHIGAAQINTLRDIGEEDPERGTIQYQLNDKMERIVPASPEPGYTVSNKIAVVNDHDLVNGRFGVKDSGAIITDYYTPGDQLNPATGSAIHQAIAALEGTHTSDASKMSITVATDHHGIIDSVTIDDSGLATAEQGAKADSAVQTVTLNGTELSGNNIDLGNLKTTQTAVTDPANSGNTQTYEFISTISQDTNGVITATKNLIPDANTNSTKGVVTLAGSIGATVYQENGKAATEKAVRDAINDLNVDNIEGFDAGKTLATLEENNGKISATFQDIAITKSQVTDFSHSHGNITNDGTIGSDSNKVLVTTTDGAIVAGDIEGTYSDNNPIATKSTVDEAIAALDSPDRAVENQFVTVVSENDGIIAVTKARPTIGNVNGLTERLEGIDNSLSALDSNKADKVTGANNGNLAGLDSNGNLTDSGYHVVNTYKVSGDKTAYEQNPVTGTAVDLAIAESASSDRQYVDDKIDALDATETGTGTNMSVTVTEVDGKITGVSVTDNTVNATDVANKVETEINKLDSTKTGSGPNVSVTVAEVDGKIDSVSVTDNSINSTDLTDAIEGLYAEATSSDGTNVQFKVTEVDGKITAVNVTKDTTVNSTDVSNAIGTAIGALDSTVATEQSGSPAAGKNFAISVTEENGVLTGVSITRDDTVNSSDIDDKINTLDVDNLEPGDAGYDANKSHINGFGPDKTLATLTETDGKIAATFQSILVGTDNIESGAVTEGKIATGAVTEGKIGTGAVTEDKIGTGAVTEGKIDSGAVTESKIGSGAVTENKISTGAVTTTKIADDAVTNDKIAVNAVNTAQIVDGAVTEDKLADDAVTNSKIADDAVDTAQLVSGAVTEGKIGTGAVSETKIGAGAVTTIKIGDGAVTEEKIGTGAITTTKIADDAVTGEKIVNGAISTAKIDDVAVTTAKINDSAVTTAKIDDGAVTYEKVTNDAEHPFPIDISGNASTANTADQAYDIVDGGTLDTRIEGIESNVASLQTGKADKVANAVSGNFAGLDTNGNLTDSGVNANTFKTKQGAVTKTGHVLKTVTSLTQNANGELDATFSDIQSATTEQKGVVQLAGSIGATVASENNKAASEKAVRDAIDGVVDGLDAEVTSSDGTNVQVKVTEVDGKITAVNITTDETEDKNNKVTSWSATTTDAHYPSEKLVKGSLDEKADKVDNATDGNFAGLDANGNLTDSGVNASTFKTKQEVVADPTASGSTLVAIDSIRQDTNGVVTATKKNIQSATTAQYGVVQLAGSIGATVASENNKAASEKAVRDAINALDVSDITANLGVGKTITALSESDGKISATSSDIQITESQVTDLTTDLASKEDLSNKVDVWSETTTDDHYPSEKLVKDSLDTKVDKTTKVNGHALSSDVTVTKGDVGLGSVVNTGDSDTPVENGTTKFTTGGAYTELNKKADKTATVSNVAYDGTNKKITKTINGTTSDVVTAATLKADMALDNVANTNITVSASDGVTDNTNNVTYKYTHPTFTATTAAAKKVGMNAEGHVVLGDSLTKADVGLDLVSNQTITVTDTSVSDGTHTFNKYVHPTTTATAAAAVKVGNDAEGHVVLGAALQKGDVGLGNVDNTSDANKPVSTAQQTALNAKLDKTAGVTAVTWDSTNKKITKTINGTTSDVVTAATLKTAMALDNVTNDAQVKRSEMGVANGVATLDNDGKVPASQLPSYIDDVIEGYYYNGEFYEEAAHTHQIPHASGKVYVDVDTNITYRWGGSTYVKIASDLALGETSSTAYRGDRGKTAYDHSQLTSGNPHNVTKADVGLGRVSNTTITVSATDGVTSNDGTTSVTYKYTHPTTTAVAASAKKVGYDNQGHVVLGDALDKGDVGLGNVDNTSDTTKKTNFTGSIASGNTGFVTGGAAYTELNKKADKTATVSTVTYDTTNKKITKTINGTTTDVVTAAKLKEDMALDLVKNQAITVTSTSVSDGTNTFNKYTHPTYTSATAAAVKVGRDGTGHVTIGAALTKSDVDLGNVDNTSDDTKKANFTGAVASGNTGFPTGDAVFQAIAANGKGYVIVDNTNTYADVKAIYDAGKIPIFHETTNDNYAPLHEVDDSGANPVFWFNYVKLINNASPMSEIEYKRISCESGSRPWGQYGGGPYIENTNNKVTSWSATLSDEHYPSEKLVKTALDGKASSTHTHGNITNAGALQTSDVTIASGDKLVITDSSDSNKVARASAAFDGSTATKALTKKGTFEDFVNQSDIDTAIENIPTISLVGDNHITVTSDDTTGTVTVATDIAAQTAYTAKGSATKVPQITTNALGQVTGITEVTISGVTPAAHTHGSITNDGKIGSTADLAVVTGTAGAVTTVDLTTAAPTVPSEGTTTATAFIDSVSQNSKGKITASKKNLPEASTSTKGIVQLAGSIGTTVSSENNKAASEKAVRDAINALDVSDITANLGVGKTITALSESDGKISATASNIQITESQVTNLTTDLGNKEDKSNKVSSWSSTTNNTRYPGEKLVKDSLDAKENTSNKVTSWQSTPDNTHYPSEKLVSDALKAKLSRTTLSVSIPGTTTRYVKMSVPSDKHHYLVFFNAAMGVLHAEWLFRTYGDGGRTRTEVNYIGAPVTIRKWYVAGASGLDYYIEFVNDSSGNQTLTFSVASLDGSSLPALTTVETIPEGYVEMAVHGTVAEQLRLSRKLAVNLANTSTDTSFNGSADQTGIKVSGTLGIANGGTGKTTAKAAVNALLGSLPAESSDMADNTPVVMRYYSPTDSNGALYTRTGSQVWSYVKGKMSSDTGVNISGNSATATTATNVDLTGSVKTTSTTNGDTIQVQAGSGTAAEITIVNAKHAASADSATKATKDSDGNAINATYFKSSGNVTLVSGSATKIGTQNGADVKLTLPSIPAAVSVKGDAETTYRTGQVNLTPANLGISATTTSVTVGSTTFSKYSHPAGSAPSVTGFPADGGTLAFGGTFDVNQVSTDSTSHVSSITKRTFTLPSLGTTATTAAKGNHTHTASIAADTGTSALAMTANTKYKLTAGGSTFIFTTPVDTTYTSKAAASGGTDVSLVTTGEKWTWNHKQDALTEMTTAEVSALVAAFAS